MSALLLLLVYRIRLSVFIKECIILLIVKELEKTPTIQINLKASNLSGMQVQRTTVFYLADKCLKFLRSYDIKEKYTHKIFKELRAIKWLKRTRMTSTSRNTGRKKVSEPYNLLWLGNFFCLCYLANLTLGQKAASWGKSLQQALAHCSLPQPVIRCMLHAPHTTKKGFWSRCTITRRGCTLLPGSQLASPYGQLFLDIAAHSEQDTVKSIIMPTEPNLHIQDHLQYESRYPGLFHLTILLSEMEKMALARLSDWLVALLSGRKTVGADLSSPQSHSKRILVNLSHIIKLLEKNAVCKSYSNILNPKGLYFFPECKTVSRWLIKSLQN